MQNGELSKEFMERFLNDRPTDDDVVDFRCDVCGELLALRTSKGR